MISYLQIDGLTKSFGDLVLFEDITFGICHFNISHRPAKLR